MLCSETLKRVVFCFKNNGTEFHLHIHLRANTVTLLLDSAWAVLFNGLQWIALSSFSGNSNYSYSTTEIQLISVATNLTAVYVNERNQTIIANRKFRNNYWVSPGEKTEFCESSVMYTITFAKGNWSSFDFIAVVINLPITKSNVEMDISHFTSSLGEFDLHQKSVSGVVSTLFVWNDIEYIKVLGNLSHLLVLTHTSTGYEEVSAELSLQSRAAMFGT